MRHSLATILLFALLVCLAASSSSAAPITKQNGSNPVFKDFTSICSVPGYVNYGLCNGDPTTFASVTGKVNAVQPKPGRWNLGISFRGLQPDVQYTLWGNQDGAIPSPGVVAGFFVIATGTADLGGNLNFSYQTSNPDNLGFDLNKVLGNVTIVTSYWSQQAIKVLNPDGTLYVPGS